jgi:type IV secretion/conjugal transfer VirB4 family ATPase
MFSLREYRRPTDRLPDYLPWACLVAPGVILQKDGVLQRTIAFRGPDLASSSGSEIVSAVARLNNALKRLGSGWAFFFEAQRFESTSYPSSEWRHPAAWVLDLERRAAFEAAGSHFESAYFLTIVWQLPPVGEKHLQALFFSDPEQRSTARDNERDLASFQKATAELIDIMRGVFAEVSELDDADTLAYLHTTVSTHRHPVGVPETPMYLDALLPDMPFTPGDIPMLGDSFMPTCTIVGFPGTSLPGVLDDLNHLRLEYRWVTRYLCLDKQDAKTEIEKYRKRWWSKRKGLWTMLKEEATKQESALVDSAAANQAADADAALQELGDDLVGFGYLTVTVTVWDSDQQQARRKLQAVKQAIQGRGFVVRDEGLNGREAWLGSLPGHVWANVRRPLVSSLNLAHLLPLSAVWAGESENGHLRKVCGRGEPHVYCSTSGATPFRLNLNVDDVGHTLIVGPTGAGKSTLLSLLVLQWLRYPNAQVRIFDKDRSARSATLAVGGQIYEPGNERVPTAFQPLRRIDDRAERVWASRFILNLLLAQHVEETPEIKHDVDQALELTATAPVEQRTLTGLTVNLANLALKAALRPYTLQGPHGQIFDADHEHLDGGYWQMFEMGHLMALGPDVVAPALDYLFHRIEEALDGRPTLLVLDEAWLFLSHPIFAPRLQAWLKTLRKKNVYVVFATQEVADAAKSSITATVVSACHTKIYLADEEALTPTVTKAYLDFGLTEAEVYILAGAQKKRDYYYRSVKGRRLFQLDLGPVALALAGMSSADDHRFFDELVAGVVPAEYAERILRYRRIDWAVQHLVDARRGAAAPLSS